MTKFLSERDKAQYDEESRMLKLKEAMSCLGSESAKSDEQCSIFDR